MPHGYNGKILHVNLSSGAVAVEEPGEAFYRKYLGGSALGLHYLLRDMPANADPLGPENILALCLSVMTGNPISGQSRVTAVAKSPLTGCIGDSQGGGFWPAELKFAGFDAIIIKGQAAKPVYLWIKDGQVELRPADHLWGKVTGDAEVMLKEELGDDKIEVLQVGPAGENGVKFAAIMSMSNRANGRTGMGAVMGSKNLKAVVVRGTNRPTVADKAGLLALTKWGAQNLDESDIAGLAKYGTAETVGGNQGAGGLPTFNYNSGHFETWEKIDGITLYDTHLRGVAEGKQDRLGRDTCYSCTVRCKRVAEIETGQYLAQPLYGGPEYETLATFGSYCGIDDLPAITLANQLCNMYGMDTISCGATIAWAMECFEEGRIGLEETGGLDLRFGNAEAMVKLTEMIGKREGFGDVLAEGSAKAAAKLGKGTEAFLITSKGMEAPAHMPQVKGSMGLIYALNPFGADHESHEHDPSYRYYPDRMAMIGLTDPQPDRVLNREKVRFTMLTQHLYGVLDSANLCAFVYGPAWQLYGPDQMLEAIQAVTGWDMDMDEMMQVGERRTNMMRAFNARDGIDREMDTLPKKFFEKALVGGISDGNKVDYAEWAAAIDMYYQEAGWDVETGNPTRHKMEALDLAWVADAIGV